MQQYLNWYRHMYKQKTLMSTLEQKKIEFIKTQNQKVEWQRLTFDGKNRLIKLTEAERSL